MLDFSADWVLTGRMERTTFQDPDVVAALASIDLKVDVTDPDDPEGAAIKKLWRFRSSGNPVLRY